MAGTVELTDVAVRFVPRFPWQPGIVYESRWLDETGAVVASYAFSLPAARPSPSNGVVAVWPSAAELPENLLRLYVEFSAPMSRGFAAENVSLLDASDAPVPLPFVTTAEELWDPRTTRLTLLLDPGRIKRGVAPNQQQGPPLRAGERYTLSIAASWPDARGNPLIAGFDHRFEVGPPDRTPPRPETWALVPPGSADDGLELRFPEPLDAALLRSALSVVDAAGLRLGGEVALAEGERRWRFVPVRPWTPGRYAVVVSPRLEDPSGNRVGRPFEVEASTMPNDAEETRLPFLVTGAS